MNRNEIYRKLICKYGEKQIVVAIEELSELAKELCKALRGNENQENIIEEIADVEIMLVQMKMYFGITKSEIEEVKEKKLERTRERLLGSK